MLSDLVSEAHIEFIFKVVSSAMYKFDIIIDTPKSIEQIIKKLVFALDFYLERDKRQEWYKNMMTNKECHVTCEVTAKGKEGEYIIFFEDFKVASENEEAMIKYADISKILST